MTANERTNKILNKLLELASTVDSIEKNKERIVTLEEEAEKLKNENTTLKEEILMLTECALELSSIVYA